MAALSGFHVVGYFDVFHVATKRNSKRLETEKGHPITILFLLRTEKDVLFQSNSYILKMTRLLKSPPSGQVDLKKKILMNIYFYFVAYTCWIYIRKGLITGKGQKHRRYSI